MIKLEKKQSVFSVNFCYFHAIALYNTSTKKIMRKSEKDFIAFSLQSMYNATYNMERNGVLI